MIAVYNIADNGQIDDLIYNLAYLLKVLLSKV